MNKKALDVLEYQKIIELLKEEAGSEMSKKIISELMPYTDVHVISEELRSTTEAVEMCIRDSFHICLNAPDRFGMLLAGGITIMIGLQLLINVAVVTSSMPATGITLPFVCLLYTSVCSSVSKAH